MLVVFIRIMEEIQGKLETLFKDVTDVTDPSCMDKVLTILEQARIENDEYMELLVKTLQGKEVTWERPPYQRSGWLTRKPPPEELEQCDNGHFTKAEGEIVQKNWKKFVQEFEVPDKPICLARWRNRTQIKASSKCPQERVRTFVTAYLARGLRRSLYQVNRYFLVQYGCPVKLRAYTPTEEKIMKICFIHRPKEACVILTEVLGREPRGINKRYLEYFNGKPNKVPKLKWELNLAAKFISHLIEYSGSSFEQLKNNTFDKQVWLQMQQVMGPEYRHLREFWISKLHVQLFAKCTIRVRTLRNIICKILESSPYEVFSDIRWKDVAKEFPEGFTYMFLYKAAKNMWCSFPDYLTCPLPELLARAAAASTKWRRKRLKSLKFHENGILTYIKYDKSLKELMRKM